MDLDPHEPLTMHMGGDYATLTRQQWDLLLWELMPGDLSNRVLDLLDAPVSVREP